MEDVACDLGVEWKDLEPYGHDKAKIPLDSFPQGESPGRLIVITAITPTPAGEGKSTTAVGLTQGLGKIGKRAALTIRQPSLGPVFGMKGGGTGGGKSVVQPANDINLHFTGDFHAVESAHNFLAAMADNAVRAGHLSAEDITWRRVTDAEDRALRSITQGHGGRMDGPLRQTGFDISAASEIMAILALARDYGDLRERLGDCVIGWKKDHTPVQARDIGAVGAMMALLKDALKPNLVQTTEGQPALVHMGPFGNIAHGCSSIVADMLATASVDYTITEAGFGADLGFEKFMDIKVRQGGPPPSAAVVVCTVRGLKWHGGVEMEALTETNMDALVEGAANLRHSIGVVKKFGLPVVVAINRFPTDAPEEVAEAMRIAEDAGAEAAVEAMGFAEGGAGMTDLASAVVDAVERPVGVKLLYEDDDSTFDKVDSLATGLYRAGKVTWGPMTRTTVRRFESTGWHFPICMAKTHLSVTTDPKMRGAPKGHTLNVREVRASAGARQFIVLAGNIITLPGLPSKPNAFDIDLSENGEVVGLLGT